jgi:anti-sigma factor RsiW
MVHFTENDPRLQEYIDGHMPAAERSVLEQHLAHCAECAALGREYQRLDRQLARAIQRPSLSHGFHARLLDQIDSEIARSQVPRTEENRLRFESNLEAQWQAYRRHFLRAQLPRFLDGIGYGAAAAIGGSLLFRLITVFLQSSGTASTNHAQHLAMALGSAVGTTILLGALAFLGKTHLARWLA